MWLCKHSQIHTIYDRIYILENVYSERTVDLLVCQSTYYIWYDVMWLAGMCICLSVGVHKRAGGEEEQIWTKHVSILKSGVYFGI